MPKVDKIDLLSGLGLVAVGLYFTVGALDYRMGTVVRMGPGFIPFSLGVIAMVLGLAIGLAALGRESELPSVNLRALLPVAASIAAFAVVLPRLGVIAAIAATVLISSLASPMSRLIPTLLVVVAVSLMIWVGFINVLGMPIPVFRSPF